MFSVNQKRQISDAVQKVLRDTNHPELPVGEIQFHLHVEGAESWSWADIRNNGAVAAPGINPWNELQASNCAQPEGEGPTQAEIHALADELLDGDRASRVDFALAVLARWGQQPAPPAEGEVAEHVRWLDFESERALKAGRYFPAEMLSRASELLGQRHPCRSRWWSND